MDEQKGGAQGAVCRLSEASAGPKARLVSSQPAWGTGFLTVSQDQGSHLTLYVENLAPSAENDYRAWLIFQDGQPSFLGSLFIGPAGRGTVTLAFDPDDVGQRGLPAQALFGVGISAGGEPILEGKLVWEPSRSAQLEPAVAFFTGAPAEEQAAAPHPFFPDARPGAWQPAKPPVGLAPDEAVSQQEPEEPAEVDLGVSAVDQPDLPYPLAPTGARPAPAEAEPVGAEPAPAEAATPARAEPAPAEGRTGSPSPEVTPEAREGVANAEPAQAPAEPAAAPPAASEASDEPPAEQGAPPAHSAPPAAPPAAAAPPAGQPVASKPAEEVRCQLEPQHALAYRANGTAVLDLANGTALITLRDMPAPKLFGKSTTTGLDYALFRAWANHSSRQGTLALGNLRKIWEDTYRLQLPAGQDLRPYDTLFITVEEASVGNEPTGPSVMAGHF